MRSAMAHRRALRGRRLRPLAQIAAGMALASAMAGCAPQVSPPTRALTPESVQRAPIRTFATTAALPPERSNADMARDFLDLHFQLEGGSTLPVFTRFETPITLRLVGSAPATMRQDLDSLLGRLHREAGVAISPAPDGQPASITIETAPRSRIQRALANAACFVVPNVSSLEEYQRHKLSEATDWRALRERKQLAIFVPADVSPQELRDCLHEELAQALGPLNDLYRLPDSVFNDDNIQNVLTGFDMLMLRATYDPALKTGMNRAEVAQRLPAILARLNPRGERRKNAPLRESPRAWIDNMATALGSPSAGARKRAAHQLAAMAQQQGWQDHRRALAHFLIGRSEAEHNPDLARAHFKTAKLYLKHVPGDHNLSAIIDSRLAAYEIASNDLEAAEHRLANAMLVARRSENAALLATLMLLEAEILDRNGAQREANALRSNSLGWSLYGFGGRASVSLQNTQIATLLR